MLSASYINRPQPRGTNHYQYDEEVVFKGADRMAMRKTCGVCITVPFLGEFKSLFKALLLQQWSRRESSRQ
jgi:hypothetical protein